MKEVKFYLDDEEYEEVTQRKGSKSYKHSYLEALGVDYTPPKTGRPSRAFDPIAYEEKMREQHLRKIREYDELHAPDVARARAELGLDLKPGESVKALDEAKWKRRE